MLHAMVLHAPGQPLRREERPDPEPGPGEVRLRVEGCAICCTDLHVVDGELPLPRLPIVPGHEIVGTVERLGPDVGTVRAGERICVPWLAHACGHCTFAGSVVRTCATSRCSPVTAAMAALRRMWSPRQRSAADATARPGSYRPLLWAGVIAWRSLRMPSL